MSTIDNNMQVTAVTSLDLSVRQGIESALEPERMQRLVDEAISEAVAKWVDEALRGWENPIAGAFKRRLGELVIPVIERVNLDNARLDVLLNSLLEQTVIGERAQILDAFGKLVMQDVGDEVKASELFDKWKGDVALKWDCSGREVEFESDPPTYESIRCMCALERHDNPSWSQRIGATLVLEVQDEDEDEDQRDELSMAVELWRWKDLPTDESLWYVHFPVLPTLKDISKASRLELLLARMEARGSVVRWDLGLGDEDYVVPDEKPEATWK